MQFNNVVIIIPQSKYVKSEKQFQILGSTLVSKFQLLFFDFTCLHIILLFLLFDFTYFGLAYVYLFYQVLLYIRQTKNKQGQCQLKLRKTQQGTLETSKIQSLQQQNVQNIPKVYKILQQIPVMKKCDQSNSTSLLNYFKSLALSTFNYCFKKLWYIFASTSHTWTTVLKIITIIVLYVNAQYHRRLYFCEIVKFKNFAKQFLQKPTFWRNQKIPQNFQLSLFLQPVSCVPSMYLDLFIIVTHDIQMIILSYFSYQKSFSSPQKANICHDYILVYGANKLLMYWPISKKD
eukprot:TRINITY_DN1703_c2_g3_i1.p2 TRINITY_DN1703_c2_g3~~TRINITY_DN1703_c2_g3_i1.p2  ORF type:complete len:290 (+),score=-19.80 TRINITY_DN1703_c2_g3_i1:994-1863(+)